MPDLHCPPHPTRTIDAVMLDLDGTLVDTLDDFTAAIHAMQRELGLPAAQRAQVACAVGKGSAHLIKTILALGHSTELDTHLIANTASSDADHDLFARAYASYQRHYAALNGRHARVYPGVLEGLAHLRSLGLPLACLTNKPQRFAQALLNHLGLAGHFLHVLGGDSFERIKPDPLPLLRTCDLLGTAPMRTLMVGDSQNDAQAADAAGCPLILLTYGYNHGQDVRQLPALAHLDSLSALREMLR